MRATQRLRVEDRSHVGEVRRMAASMGRGIGFDNIEVEHLSIVATELASNLVKHAGGGEMLVCELGAPMPAGIELLSLDRGPGIANIRESMGDGYSTTKSRGTGLGAIQRLSSLFDIYSKSGMGTAVLSIIRKRQPAIRQSTPAVEIGAVSVSVASEELCGDAWDVIEMPDRILLTVVDGLGHGEFAAEASGAAIAIFRNHPECGPKEIIERMHAALRSTRGAAVAVAEISRERRRIRFAGVGNISSRIFSADGMHNMVSHNGTAGIEIRKVDEFLYSWPEDGLLILNTDGVASHWNLEDYPGLLGRNAALVAGVLFRDFGRDRDDRTVLVMRETRSSP